MLIALTLLISLVLLFVLDDDKNQLVLDKYYRDEYVSYQNKNHDSQF